MPSKAAKTGRGNVPLGRGEMTMIEPIYCPRCGNPYKWSNLRQGYVHECLKEKKVKK